jgi:hypothetical protein
MLTINYLAGLPLVEVIYSLILACDFQNVMLFLFYLYNVTSNLRCFKVSDFKILELIGDPDLIALYKTV